MKKLKQILCTLLAAVMLLGTTTVGAGAAPAFSDADQIVHAEAVNRAAELGYFVGSDGKFMPKYASDKKISYIADEEFEQTFEKLRCAVGELAENMKKGYLHIVQNMVE